MAYEKYTIDQFMSAWFDKDYSVISKEEFNTVHSEYLDTSGLYLSEDFEKQSYIYHLNGRINYIKMFIRLQRDFIKSFEMPFIRDFEKIRFEYGYRLEWKNDLDDFESQLKKIELRQLKHKSFLEGKIKELNEFRKNKNKNNTYKEEEIESVDKLKPIRESFIRMYNSLNKIGFRIDKNSTTVEEFALMIKQQKEENDKK